MTPERLIVVDPRRTETAERADPKPVAPANGSPLEVRISVARTSFAPGEEIPVEVTYANVSAEPLVVLKRTMLEGWPLCSSAVHKPSGQPAQFLCPARK